MRCALIDPSLDVSEYESFLEYLKTIRTPSRPYDRFVSMAVNLPRKVAVEYLARAALDQNTEVVCEGLDLLTRLSPESSRSRCIELLSHESPEVRLVAVRLLCLAESPCEDDILQLLSVEANGDVRHACVRYIAQLGTSKSIPTLQNMISNDGSINYEGQPIRPYAEEALTRIISTS